MDERRRQPRRDLMSYSQVFDLYNGKLIGYLGDLNQLGAMVISEETMEVNTTLTISIQLPDLPNIKATRVALPVRVAYCHKDLSPEYFNIGMQFKLVTDHQRTVIEAVVKNYEFRREMPEYPPHPTEME
jgi:hypothetical protein